MSRPFRTLFALCLVASSVGLSGCGTIYTPMYSNQKSYFKPTEVLKKGAAPELTAEQVMERTDAQNKANGVTAPLAPADPNAPPPAPAPAPDATAIPPATATPPPATPPPAQ